MTGWSGEGCFNKALRVGWGGVDRQREGTDKQGILIYKAPNLAQNYWAGLGRHTELAQIPSLGPFLSICSLPWEERKVGLFVSALGVVTDGRAEVFGTGLLSGLASGHPPLCNKEREA